ncbi:hypothetical protein AGIG_G13881 [Arapaima gigas]
MGQHFPVRIVPGSLLKFTDAVTIWGRVGFRKDIPCLQEYESRTHFRSGSAQPGYSPAVTVRNAARQTRYGLNKTSPTFTPSSWREHPEAARERRGAGGDVENEEHNCSKAPRCCFNHVAINSEGLRLSPLAKCCLLQSALVCRAEKGCEMKTWAGEQNFDPSSHAVPALQPDLPVFPRVSAKKMSRDSEVVSSGSFFI